jgi:tRNA(fMet)-specific endonuclease VapC
MYDGAYGLPNSADHVAAFCPFLSGYEVLGLTDEAMEFFAKTRKALRRQGAIVPDLDLLIAATAVANDCALLTRNLRHSQRVPDRKLAPRG